jgi:hypothetical protein
MDDIELYYMDGYESTRLIQLNINMSVAQTAFLLKAIKPIKAGCNHYLHKNNYRALLH